MTEQEKTDLEFLRKEIDRIKKNTFDYLRTLDRATPEELTYSGYRNMTNAEAMRKAYQNAVESIDKLTREHVRKYPDEGIRNK
jgi:ABC-type oligopeptide transport system ATPase subunit